MVPVLREKTVNNLNTSYDFLPFEVQEPLFKFDLDPALSRGSERSKFACRKERTTCLLLHAFDVDGSSGLQVGRSGSISGSDSVTTNGLICCQLNRSKMNLLARKRRCRRINKSHTQCSQHRDVLLRENLAIHIASEDIVYAFCLLLDVLEVAPFRV